MIKINGKEWDKCDDKTKIAFCDKYFDDAREARAKNDFEWYMNYMFVDGNHYVTYNTSSKSLETPPRKRGEVRMVINKIKSNNRAIQNYSTRHEPKWEVVPSDIDDKSIAEAHEMRKIMDALYRDLNLETMVEGTVDSGLNTSVGFVELDWDKNGNDGEGNVSVIEHDSFDIYLDRRSYIYGGEIQGRFIAKAIGKDLDDIASDDRYDKKTRGLVKEEKEASTSQMKNRIIEKREGSNTTGASKRAIVKEFYLWDYEGNTAGGKIHRFTYAGGQVLRDEDLKNKKYPIYVFQIQMNNKRIYQRSWTADLIPINKAIDRVVSQKIMYVNQALVYRVIAEKGHGVANVTTDMGELIEINKGRKWEQMDMNPYPNVAETLEGNLNMYHEDLGGAHDAAVGRMPAGARSGDMIEALQAADSNNLVGIKRSLQSFLAIIGEAILEIMSDHVVASRVVDVKNPSKGQKGYAKIVGEAADEKIRKQKGVLTIKKKNKLIVKIGSWLGQTLEGQRETLMKMAELKIIPTDEILKQFEFPNVEELSAKARDERLEQQSADMAIAGRGGPSAPAGGEGTTPAGPGGLDTKKIADKENMDMMNGQPLPPTEGADINHTQAHRDFMNTQMFTEAPPEVQQIFKQHVQGELQNLGMAQ